MTEIGQSRRQGTLKREKKKHVVIPRAKNERNAMPCPVFMPKPWQFKGAIQGERTSTICFAMNHLFGHKTLGPLSLYIQKTVKYIANILPPQHSMY